MSCETCRARISFVMLHEAWLNCKTNHVHRENVQACRGERKRDGATVEHCNVNMKLLESKKEKKIISKSRPDQSLVESSFTKTLDLISALGTKSRFFFGCFSPPFSLSFSYSLSGKKIFIDGVLICNAKDVPSFFPSFFDDVVCIDRKAGNILYKTITEHFFFFVVVLFPTLNTYQLDFCRVFGCTYRVVHVLNLPFNCSCRDY